MGKARRKDVKEAEARLKRKEEQKKRKLISREVNLERASAKREQNRQILVVTEGTHTETSYLEHFQIPGVTVTPVGLGMSTMKLVNEVERIKQYQRTAYGKIFDEVWVAFDHDDFPDFMSAVDAARAKGYKIACSNQAFEYWLLLHFKDHQGQAMNRSVYCRELNNLIGELKAGVRYDCDSKTITDDIFELLLSINPTTRRRRMTEAYYRAKAIADYKIQNGNPWEESVTYVYELIKSLFPDIE